ncbi:MAG: hypothetical protein PVG87_15005, partial [Desulfobacteraceae bacterium]
MDQKSLNDNHIFRGLLQSNDGIITRVIDSDGETMTFETTFGLKEPLIERLKHYPEHILFSERSRIARLGVQIKSEPPSTDGLDGDTVTLTLVASSAIPGYPRLDEMQDIFTLGMPVGRLVFCDPEALLTSDEVLAAIQRSELKLPASTTISADGSIVIAPHKVVCDLREPMDRDTLARILLREDGREILNLYQIPRDVPVMTIDPGKGVITTCSMYLNEHYVVLQSGFELGRNLPATVLDPIKTRGIRIYLEIINQTRHPIVNPLISARIYCAAKSKNSARVKKYVNGHSYYGYGDLRKLEKRLNSFQRTTCHFLEKPIAVIQNSDKKLGNPQIFLNGPGQPCSVTKAMCAVARRDYSPKSDCSHVYATSKLDGA